MEGTAIGHVADMYGVPSVVIRSISENADSNAVMDYDEFERTTAINSAMLVLNMLELLSLKI
ncbi:hypothetical protein [Thermoclostridium stercorarium]|uniref:phosphorylase family protein n=1 Tax=Thermoclostridium stercorarium TaxID=1510 RepID=UPI000A84E8C2|nr:hypothetical protein [Thermoclostridium stercorarium]